jgi:hypothetical protein
MHGGFARRQGGSIVQRSPHAFPVHGSLHCPAVAVTQRPAPSHAVAAKVGQGLARPHGLHGAPQAAPAQSASPQLNVPWATHAPDASQAFTTAVSTQLASSGAHCVQLAPQTLPAHGS